MKILKIDKTIKLSFILKYEDSILDNTVFLIFNSYIINSFFKAFFFNQLKL